MARPTTSRRDTAAGRFYRILNGSERPLTCPLTGTVDWPSCTHVLSVIAKPALVAWAANTERALCVETAADLYEDLRKIPPMPRAAFVSTFDVRLGKMRAYKRESEKAVTIGAQVHTIIEWSLRKALGQVVGPEPRIRDEALVAYMSFQDWCLAHVVEPIAMEQTVWHPTLGYAGTLDLVARVDGQLAVLDVKSSKAIYPEYALQVNAYAAALEAMGHPSPETSYILRLPKSLAGDLTVEVQVCPPRAATMPVFEAALQLWWWAWQAEQQRQQAWRERQAAAHEPPASGEVIKVHSRPVSEHIQRGIERNLQIGRAAAGVGRGSTFVG